MTARGLQRLHRCPNREGGAIDVRQHHRAPMLRRGREKAAPGAETGVRKRDVYLAETADRRFGHGFLVSPLGDVALDGKRAFRTAELICQRAKLLLAACAKHEPVAGLRGAAGSRLADPTGGTGDEEDRIGHHSAPTRARANSRASNGWRSSSASPTPTSFTGSASS